MENKDITVYLKSIDTDNKVRFNVIEPTPSSLLLKEVFEWPSREVYTTILNLTNDEDVSGQVIGTGSISVNGNSALRRTVSGLTLQVSEDALAQDYNWVMTDEIRIFQGISNERTNNEIWYFNLGTYVLSSFSAAESLQGTKISISAKDKMVLLNGEQGGTFVVDTELDKDLNNNPIPLTTIITNIVSLAGIPNNDIIICDEIEKATGRELLEYRGSDPLYLFGSINNEKTTIESVTPFGDTEVIYNELGEKKRLDQFNWGEWNNETKTYLRTIKGPGLNTYNITTQSITRITLGEVAGYKIIELMYPGALTAKQGETVVTILDRIISALGKEYEYFFDVNGKFCFQKKQALLSITRLPEQSINSSNIGISGERISQYDFYNGSLFTQLNRAPKIENIKNDFVIWGTRSVSADGSGGNPIHARYVIDEPFAFDYKVNKDEKITYITTTDQTQICEYLYKMANNELSIPPGKEYYKQFFPDIKAYWRDIYNPSPEAKYLSTSANIKTGPKTPTHWYGNKITDLEFNEINNIYCPKEVGEQIYYSSLSDLIDLSQYNDVFDVNGNSLYNRTQFEQRALVGGFDHDRSLLDDIPYIYDSTHGDFGYGLNVSLTEARKIYCKEKDNNILRPLYSSLPISLANIEYENELWDNNYRFLCYETADEEYAIVKTFENEITTYDVTHTPKLQEIKEFLTSNEVTKVTVKQPEDTSWKEINANGGQFILMSPNSDFFVSRRVVNGNLDILHEKLERYKRGIYYYKQDDDIYIPLVNKFIEQNHGGWIKKNNWRFLLETISNKNDPQSYIYEAPLDTILIDKSLLYDNTKQLIQPNLNGFTDQEKANFIQINTSGIKQITELEKEQLQFNYAACDWTGQQKIDGAITSIKTHPVFYELPEYNQDTHKKIIYEQDPALLPFELIFINPSEQDTTLSKNTVSSIGDRVLVKNEKSITALKSQKNPPLYFSTTSTEMDAKVIPLTPALEKLFILSSQGIDAATYIKNLLYEHAYCTENITISTIPIYFLEPNGYIKIIENDKEYLCILNNFSIPLSYNGTMSLTFTLDKLASQEIIEEK